MENLPHRLKFRGLNDGDGPIIDMDNQIVMEGSSYNSNRTTASTERLEHNNSSSTLPLFLRSNKPPTTASYNSFDGAGGFGSRLVPPLPPIDNQVMMVRPPPPMCRTPVKAVNEEGTFVMDGVPVELSAERKPLRSSSSNFSVNSGSSLGEGSSSPYLASSPLAVESPYKMEMCRVWQEGLICPFGFNCLALICKFYNAGSCIYGTNCRFLHQPMALSLTEAVAPAKTQAAVPTKAETAKVLALPEASVRAVTQTTSPVKLGYTSKTPLITSIGYGDWSPPDDGIEMALPSSADKAPSRQDLDEYINKALYGSNIRRRLPVFAELCKE